MKLKAHHSSEPPLEFMEYNEDRSHTERQLEKQVEKDLCLQDQVPQQKFRQFKQIGLLQQVSTPWDHEIGKEL